MREYQFKCFLKSDIILKSLSATENNNETLDYIPGAKFLGIVAAQLYCMDQKEKTLRLFHSDSVRFGDAHPFIDGEYSFKIPYAWFLEKGANVAQGVELMLHNSKEITASYRMKGSQLKQVRKGYLAPDVQKVVELETTYSIKSSYDASKRKSKDAQMFGYNALQKGSVWSFSVQCELEEDIKGGREEISRLRYLDFVKGRVERNEESFFPYIEVETPKGEIDIWLQKINVNAV